MMFTRENDWMFLQVSQKGILQSAFQLSIHLAHPEKATDKKWNWMRLQFSWGLSLLIQWEKILAALTLEDRFAPYLIHAQVSI